MVYLIVVAALMIGAIAWALVSSTALAPEGVPDFQARDREILSTVECPSCHHFGARRVGMGERTSSGLIGGLLFSRKARAQFQCSRCDYLW